ncbi:uncharacterized protein LOC135810102 [Sycon ciliatum]|uniref:uncharacterized protein LOC135810102 n=1 Tax=Sycon ciliatum TaxID=27933 RepID=UPI0031F61AA9
MDNPPVSISSGRNLGEKLFSYIDNNVVGKDAVFQSKYGKRRVVYCDYTASGRSLSFIEDFLRKNVMPYYANTHTTTGITSRQSTYYLQEARDIIRNAVNASSKDSVLFTGNGCTGAIHKLVSCLCETWSSDKQQPVVFTGPYEHHSVILPFREAGFEVIRVGQSPDGGVDMEELESKLKDQPDGRHVVGCFSAASNVTGQLVDTTALSICLHRHGALAFFDYATAAPYVQMDMNPVTQENINHHLAHKDAIFISPHKFVGGVDTPGVLVAKSILFSRHAPSVSGGGSVLFVSRSTHTYLSETELREEAGTPNILASIRAGLAFQLKEAVGTTAIMQREHDLLCRARTVLTSSPNITVLGNTDSEQRLPIFSFLVRHPATGRFLHYNYVSTLLNDLFGIQTRGGCMCAGPYALDLLGIKEDVALELYKHLEEDDGLDQLHLRRYHFYSKRGILRPGFSRFSLPYFMSDEEVDYILSAIALVAEHGWKLLPQYKFDIHSGEWKHLLDPIQRQWLGSISYASGGLTAPTMVPAAGSDGDAAVPSYKECLSLATQVFESAASTLDTGAQADQRLVLPESAERLRWYVLPSEITSSIRSNTENGDNQSAASSSIPVQPVTSCSYHTASAQQESSSVGHPSTHCNDDRPSAGNACNGGSHREVESSTGPTNQQTSSVEADGRTSVGVDTSRSNTDNACSARVPSDLFLSWPPAHQRLRAFTDQNRSCSACTARPESTVNGQSTSDNSTSPVSTDNSSQERDQVCQLKSAKGRQQKADAADSKPRFVSPPKAIFKLVLKALDEFSMIGNGDRVLVALSGGKDSLSLLHTLHQYQFVAKKKGILFDLGAVTIDPQTEAYDPSPLKAYLSALGVPYYYEEQGILAKATALGEECTSICSFCSRMKRGRLYAAMRREGYNVLAMGQHLDDLTESFMMSCFHNGLLRTMKANYTVQSGDLRVIRPLVFVREEMLRHFAEQARLPVITENCPACFEAPKERHRVKRLLAEQEAIFPQLYRSLQSALHPLMAKRSCGMESGCGSTRPLNNGASGEARHDGISDEED